VLNLYMRFRELDKGHKGYISSDELLNVPELSLNPLALVIITRPRRPLELTLAMDHASEREVCRRLVPPRHSRGCVRVCACVCGDRG
jgi:hypothetical protein